MITLQVFLLVLGVAGSSFFSGAETGYITWNVLKVKHRAFLGDIVARWGVYLVQRRDQLISAILIGNNIANIGASLAFVALYEKALPSLPAVFARIPSPESWILTPFLLLTGEMLPKSLFRMYPFRLTMKITPFMMLFYTVTFPLTALFSKVTELTRKRKRGSGGSYFAAVREEMVLIASEGSKTGSLFRSADQFMETFLLLDEKKVAEVIEPQVCEFPLYSGRVSIESIRYQLPEKSSYLLVKGTGGGVVGYVVIEDVLSVSGTTTLSAIMRKTRKIRTNQSLLAALRSVTTSREQLFEVLDYKGTTIDFLTMPMLFRAAFQNFQVIS